MAGWMEGKGGHILRCQRHHSNTGRQIKKWGSSRRLPAAQAACRKWTTNGPQLDTAAWLGGLLDSG
jgi:hypothetical protein